jgi:hypothetical protein
MTWLSWGFLVVLICSMGEESVWGQPFGVCELAVHYVIEHAVDSAVDPALLCLKYQYVYLHRGALAVQDTI